ncbi:hypothetical protein [Nonomuraea recticatena]|uniref:hypothetical protein n=1 Tax=Nonomuraea recticatena TaxID=46178 RepID=UPI0031F9D440
MMIFILFRLAYLADATAFLAIGGHSVDGVGGYDIGIAASCGEVPEGGGLLC